MKTMMKILCLVLALIMVAGCLAACGEDAPKATEPDTTTAPSKPTDPSEPAPTDPPVDDGKKEYKIKATNPDGNPVEGALLQICKEGATCYTPTRTNDQGVATWRLDEAADYYGTFSSSVPGMPKENFGADFEVTIVLDSYKIKVVDTNGDPVVGLKVCVGKEGCSEYFTPVVTNDQGEAVFMLPIFADFYGTVSSTEEGMPKENFGDKFEVTLVYNPPVTE